LPTVLYKEIPGNANGGRPCTSVKIKSIIFAHAPASIKATAPWIFAV